MLAEGFSYTVFITSTLSLWRVCLVFLGPHLWHMKFPRLGVKLELWLPAYTTATAMQDPSCICDLHHSSWQHQILSPLSNARDWTGVLMDTTQVHYHWATIGTLKNNIFKKEQTTSKVSRGKVLTKIRAELGKVETRTTIEKNSTAY